MSFEIIVTEPFERKLKKLFKKYRSISKDLSALLGKLSETPEMGIPLGKDCYKIRLAISSIGKGKSGGARIITYVRIVKVLFTSWIFMTSPNNQLLPLVNYNFLSTY